MSRRRAWLRLGAALLAGGLLAGCAWIRGGQGGGEIAHPGGEALVLRVYTTGGFVPTDYQLTSLPAFTLLGDGRVIVPGATDLRYPGPVLPSLQVRQLNERGIQSVLQTVQRTGQLEEDRRWSGASSHVADAGSVVFVLHAGGRDVTVSVYALGIMEGGIPDLADEERQAHVALGQLMDDLGNLDAWVGSRGWTVDAWRPYEAEALRLIVRQTDGETRSPDDLPYDERPWPSDRVAPADFGDPVLGARCGVVTGPEALDWYDALDDANQLTRWLTDGHRYVVVVRPLMPDEPRDCAPAA